MDDWTPARRIRFGTWWSVGLGLLAGVFETAGHAATQFAPLGLSGFALLGAATVMSTGVLGGVFGLLLGGFFHGAARGGYAADKLSVHLGAVGAALAAWYLWPETARIIAEGRGPVALVLAAMPLLCGTVVYFNARYWLRRQAAGRDIPVGWMPVVAAMVTFMVAGISGVWSLRDVGGRGALEGDPNVLIVSIDGLRADAVAPSAAQAKTPRLAAFAASGISYEQAISPSAGLRASSGALLTGRHPLRLSLVADSDPLGRRYTSLAELFEQEGYATGGFVSDATLQRSSGLHQGFRTWDDTLGPLGLGLERTSVIGPVLRLLGLASHRSDVQTVDRAEGWLHDHATLPFFAWVHLQGPALAEAGSYQEAVANVDEQVGRLLDVLEDEGIDEGTMVVVVGSHGRLLGAHGMDGTEGVWDEVVRVPLLVRAPGADVRIARVPQQVRTYDVFPAVLAWAKFDEHEEAEGIDLLGYAVGRREKGLWISLVGQAAGAPVLGLRINGIKYIKTLAGAELLFDLQRDPREVNNLSEKQAETLMSARMQIASEEARLKSLVGEE